MNKNFIVYNKTSGEIIAQGHCPANDVTLQIRDRDTQAVLVMHDLLGIRKATHKVKIPASDHCGCTSGCGANCGAIETLTLGE